MDDSPVHESPDDEASVRGELSRLKEFGKELSLEDLHGGAWFAKLLRFSLDKYVQEVDAAYFRAKYPDLPPDAVVRARIRMAARYAGIEGGLSAGAYTGTVAATIGSGGGASPLTLPAATLTFATDLLYTSQLQLRLAHDIAVLYGVFLDLSDPEDLWKLIHVAFGVKAGEVGRGAVAKGVPALLRPVIKKVFAGSTLAATKSLPIVGKYLLQRNIIKFTIPAVGVPLSIALNYWLTRVGGDQAVKMFRDEARIAEAARRMVQNTEHHEQLLWVLWLIVRCDGPVHELEALLLKHVTALVRGRNPALPALDELRSVIEVDHSKVWSLVSSAGGEVAALYDAAVSAAAVDGKINAKEQVELKKLADLCLVDFDESALRAAGKRSA